MSGDGARARVKHDALIPRGYRSSVAARPALISCVRSRRNSRAADANVPPRLHGSGHATGTNPSHGWDVVARQWPRQEESVASPRDHLANPLFLQRIWLFKI